MNTSTCKRIDNIINLKEKEKIKLELKSFSSLIDSSKRGEFIIKLAQEIVALANTYGGKLILGVQDDGVLDGKFLGNVDHIKRDVIDICRDKISPIIDCTIEFIECEKGDVFEIIIPQRKLMPHAYAPNKEGSGIKNRIYYIRTSHGKKLVNDIELLWIFKNEGYPNLSNKFTVALEFSKDLVYRSEYVPRGCYYINNFLNGLSKTDKEIILKNNENLRIFFC